MDCACRTAALRIFVKNIAHIHVPPRTPTRLAQYQAHLQPSRLYHQRPASVLATASRALHTSCARNGAAEAARAVEAGVEGADKHEDAGARGVTSLPSEPATDPFTPTKPRRRGRTDATSFKARNAASFRAQTAKALEAGPKRLDDRAKSGGRRETNRFKPRSDHRDSDWQPKPKETWMSQKDALTKKFPDGWNPRKKLSPDALVGIRMLHQQFPQEYTTEVLAQKFEVSAEAIRRILKSKWAPDPEKESERQERWFNRGKQVWSHWAAIGKKPPRKWRAEGIVRDPIWNKPRGPNHKDKAARADAQRRLAKRTLF
ncbi:hypothetical protein C8A00DRAFT_15965 [Chaetomidium leptoderma]|uniref:Required for respiratory growth protein 9, mitochondrial n=1 Tax=Chaetomidium leptoderma TaxID=669021 RepID=A0AAN6VLY6_9PEZI|nr:hypothetical protein C8A00DRAFT_15965 [Chaetomidium leptoderma]